MAGKYLEDTERKQGGDNRKMNKHERDKKKLAYEKLKMERGKKK